MLNFRITPTEQGREWGSQRRHGSGHVTAGMKEHISVSTKLRWRRFLEAEHLLGIFIARRQVTGRGTERWRTIDSATWQLEQGRSRSISSGSSRLRDRPGSRHNVSSRTFPKTDRLTGASGSLGLVWLRKGYQLVNLYIVVRSLIVMHSGDDELDRMRTGRKLSRV